MKSVATTITKYLLLLTLTVGCAEKVEPPPSAPQTTLVNAEPTEILQAVKAANQVVLLNVWATWCQPCREEFPDILKLHRNYKEKGLSLVLVSADFDRHEESAKQFLKEQGVEFVSYRKLGKDEDFINSLNPDWSGSLPASFVYDRNGQLIDFWEGMASYESFEQRVTAVLETNTK